MAEVRTGWMASKFAWATTLGEVHEKAPYCKLLHVEVLMLSDADGGAGKNSAEPAGTEAEPAAVVEAAEPPEVHEEAPMHEEVLAWGNVANPGCGAPPAEMAFGEPFKAMEAIGSPGGLSGDMPPMDRSDVSGV